MRASTILTLTLASLSVIATAPSWAVTITKAKQSNLLHNQTESPFFSSSADGLTNFLPAPAGGAIWAPSGTVQAGQVTTLTSVGAFSILGDSTSAGADLTPGTSDDWLDGNGIPAGITLAFDAQLTISVGAGSPTGSWLTIPGNSATPLGGGVGVTQVQGGTSTIDSLNLNEVPAGDPNDTHESIDVSAVSVSNVSFSGALAEAGFSFTPGTVDDFGPRVLRANAFTESAEFAELRPSPTDPATIGFGQSPGTVASNVFIDNSFTNAAASFPRQVGAFTLAPTNATIGLKGISYEYDVTYGITAATTAENADFDGDGDVDGADFLTWQQNAGVTSGGTRSDGNANPAVDGAIDAVDLAIWNSQFATTPPPSSVAATAVPEPSALILAIASGAALFAQFKTNRRSPA